MTFARMDRLIGCRMDGMTEQRGSPIAQHRRGLAAMVSALLAVAGCSSASTGSQSTPTAPSAPQAEIFSDSMQAVGLTVNSLDARCIADVFYEIPELEIVIDPGRNVQFRGVVEMRRVYRPGVPSTCPPELQSTSPGIWGGVANGSTLTTIRGTHEGCPLFVGERRGDLIVGRFSCDAGAVNGLTFYYSGPFEARKVS